MLNRPLSMLFPPAEPDGPLWDRRPATRLFGLGLFLLCSLLLIGGRVTWLKLQGPEAFSRATPPVVVTTESIPTHDGRVLAADGTVLAFDRLHFGIRMHYRWLEQPPDRSWLLGQALARLSPSERRESRQLERARRDVLKLRGRMHAELAELCGTSPGKLQQRMTGVQRRVERIVASVLRRRRAAAMPAPTAARLRPRRWWHRAWLPIREALTTPPRRAVVEPLVVTEEREYHSLLDGITLEAAAEIEEHPERFPGVELEIHTRRIYPAGTLAAHVVGSRRRVFPTSQAGDTERVGRPVIEWIGATGVERSYDSILHGRPGLKRIVTNRQGEVLSTKVLREPRHGRDVELTLWLPLQRAAEEMLDEATATGSPGGAIVVLDIHTGTVAAAASAPRFDPNLLISPDEATWKKISTDPRRPLFCRITGMALPPGSVFKSLTATALLQSGLLPANHQVTCRGYLDHPGRYRCYIFRHFGSGHGDTDLGDALCRSCNVFFFDAARRLARSGSPGHQALHSWAARFGFGQRTGIDLPGESPGKLPAVPSRPRVSETMQLAIGQGAITVTPLQIARLMAAIANGGLLVTPRVAGRGEPKRPGVGGGSPVATASTTSPVGSPAPARRIEGLSPGTLEAVRAGLRRVVADPRGTGYRRVRVPGIAIAGKTGTAEVGGDLEDHAWFAGYVPAQQPRFAFVVVLEHAGSGGRAAGPVARRLVEAMLETGLLPPLQVTRLE